MGFKITVDTGGTFTDVVVSAAGREVIGKALTTPERIFDGMRGGLEATAEQLGLPVASLLRQTDLLIYGTTRATNAIVEHKTAKTAFLCTEGFPNILLFREGGRLGVHDFATEFPPPYIPRNRTFEVTERINADGEIVVPIDAAATRALLGRLGAAGYEAVAVCLLWSIANSAHEEAIGAWIEEAMPGVPYTLSHALIPIVREYRRASAAAIDASLKPLMQDHLRGMQADLRAAGFDGALLVSSSVGGCVHVDSMIEKPINTCKSGPAMAPVAAKRFAAEEGLGEDVIVCDAGGTTFDVGLVREGGLVYTRDTWLGGQYSGHILANSTVDIRSIGAGGGSIAWVDKAGLLRVGPHSAGSAPGPACYGRGGEAPTVTDASLVLGYLDPGSFLGGRMTLDPAAARRAVERVAAPLSMSAEAAAWAIVKIADELMVKAIQEITITEGFNPKDSALVAGGGAAGLNIMPIAAELGVGRVVLPRMAGALSAAGMQYADIISEESGSLVTNSAAFDFDGVNALLAEMERRLGTFLDQLGRFDLQNTRYAYAVEARYAGQVWELDAPLAAGRFHQPQDVEAMVDAFHAVHERVYAVRDPASSVECLNWKVRVEIPLARASLAPAAPAASAAAIAGRCRHCFFGAEVPMETSIYRGEDLSPGAEISGPAIIEEPTTTVVVYPEMSVRVSERGNYLLSTGA